MPPPAAPTVLPYAALRAQRGCAASLLAAVVLLAASPSGWAVPDATDKAPVAAQAEADPITQLLVDRGVLPAGTAGVVQSMRDRASDLVVSAMNFLGVPYRRGGQSADDGFDCSGFTRHIFELSLGLVLPRRAAEQAQSAALKQVPSEELKPGDLVFFNTMRRAFSHVGIYVGDGKFIHAPRSGSEVRIEDMRQAYWRARFNGARRAEKLQASPAAPAALEAVPVLSRPIPAVGTVGPNLSPAPAAFTSP